MKVERRIRSENQPVASPASARNELLTPAQEGAIRGNSSASDAHETVDDPEVSEVHRIATSRLEGLELEDEHGFSRAALANLRAALNAAGRDGREIPIRLVEFTRAFYLGGTETQLIELLRGLPPHYRVRVGALQAEGPLFESIRAMGHTPATFPLGNRFLRPGTLKQVARLAAWFRNERIELVHVHDFTATLLAVPAAKLAGAKVIVSRLDLAHYHSSAQRSVLRHLTRLADHVIVNAEAIRTMVAREDGIPLDRISLIRNGIDLKRFDRNRLLGLNAALPETGQDPVMVHVANMNHPVKRQEDVIEAVRRLRASGIRLHTFFVGDGPRRPELERLARSSGVDGWTHFLGHRTDVAAIYARASLGVLCSSAEGLSNAIIEGMAAALPMVVTDVGGSSELVGAGSRGWVVPPMRPDALCAAIAEVLRCPDRGRHLGQLAREHVERELTLEQMVKAHDAVYRNVCDG